MRNSNSMNTYIIPNTRYGDPQKSNPAIKLKFETGDGYGIPKVIVSLGDIKAILIGDQIVKATKNSMNTVKGCMDVSNELQVFDSIPQTYEEVNSAKPTKDFLI